MVEINDVPCRRCKAPAGQGCVTPSGNPANEPHSVRVSDCWKAEAVAKEETHLHCSSCGSDAPHHLAYVKSHGLCVI